VKTCDNRDHDRCAGCGELRSKHAALEGLSGGMHGHPFREGDHERPDTHTSAAVAGVGDTVLVPELANELPRGSVVLDVGGRSWQSPIVTSRKFEADPAIWSRAGDALNLLLPTGKTWQRLILEHGPLKVLYVPDGA
jgi:hypothetical protein